jgi:hypothetical protein
VSEEFHSNSPNDAELIDGVQKLGLLVWQDTATQIINNLLQRVIPEESSKLSTFDSIVQLTSNFESRMVALGKSCSKQSFNALEGFIKETDVLLGDFVRNIDTIFADKKRVQILERVRVIIANDSHSMIKAPKLKSFYDLAEEYKDKIPDKKEREQGSSVLPKDDEVERLLFLFPDCKISETTLQILDWLTNLCWRL